MKNRGSITLSPVSLIAFVLLTLILSGCGIVDQVAPDPTVTAESTAALPPTTAPAGPILGLATVESLEILKQDTFPVEVDIRVAGVLPNACTDLDDIIVQRDGDAFTAAVTTVQDPQAACAQALVPFEQIVPLDVAGLPAGTYTVTVNNTIGSFILDADNEAPTATAVPETDPTPAPTASPAPDAALFTIDGRVWHDICTGVAGEDGQPPAGCITAEDGAIVADGLLQDEPGIAGVTVTLARGACPAAEALTTTTTDADGVFSFADLAADQYCVTIDPADAQNETILPPGRWTTTTGDLAQIDVTVGADAAAAELSLGWDYDLLPADLASCTNSFEFVEDLTVPDDTTFAPGQEFSKQWRLRNNGTCPWDTDYTVQFVGGDQMGAPDSVPLAQAVPVSQTLDVAVSMIAPLEPGTYRGNWQLAAPDGELFGIDGNIGDAFWLQIIVDEESTAAATPLPDSGAIGGVVWEDFCINSNPGAGCVEPVAGTFIGDGSFDALDTAWSGITISLAAGACPAPGTLPADVLSTAVSGEDGRYLFEGLSAGTYCIFMDALSPENVDFLIPGNWTWPATGVGQYSFILDPGEQALDLDFGWDYFD